MDTAFVFTETGIDLALELGDLKHDDGLRTAILVSLFSDGRVEVPEDLPDGETDPRGWWADAYDDIRMGSLLWTLERGKITGPQIAQIQSSAEAALEWLLRDDLAEEVRVIVTRLGTDRLFLRVELVRGQSSQGADLWESMIDDARTFETPLLQVQVLTA